MDKPYVTVTQGETKRVPLLTPWDLTGYSVSAQLRDRDGTGALAATLTTEIGVNTVTGLNGLITATLSPNDSAPLLPTEDDDLSYAFDVRLIAPGSGDVLYIPRIWFSVVPRATR